MSAEAQRPYKLRHLLVPVVTDGYCFVTPRLRQAPPAISSTSASSLPPSPAISVLSATHRFVSPWLRQLVLDEIAS